MEESFKKHRLLIIGIVIGVIYGLVTRIVFDEKATLASITYLFLIPTVLGFIPLAFAGEEQLRSYRNIIFIPWICVTTFFLVMYLFGLEEFICLLVLGGPFFILGTIGALIYKFLKLSRQKRKNVLMSVFFLPLVFAPIEELFTDPSQEYSVVSEIRVHATPKEIWNQIVRVEEIKQAEYRSGFFNQLGIPRPIAAELLSERVGGLRIGKFEGGLQFTEEITTWEPFKEVSFNIAVDPGSVRSNVFDQHVLNGNYFKFVNAAYELEPVSSDITILRLKSGYRLTSKINFYGKLWGDWILSDFQDRLLVVLKNRCEKA